MRHAAPSPLIDLHDIPAALGLLTRLPIRFGDKPPRGAAAAWAYPVAGLVAGGISTGAAVLALVAGLSPSLAAGICLGTGIIVTGALHQDGLADCADGFWGGWTVERRLEIMKDSQIGSYGVLALIVITGLMWQAISQLLVTPVGALALIAAAMASRAAMVATMCALPHARAGGLSASVGRPARTTALLAAVIGASALVLLLGLVGLAACGAGLVAMVAVALIARAKIGGQTGDVLGATQQVAELAILLTCAAML